jgi:hypothetical protein
MLAALRANVAATIFGALAAVFALVAVVQTVKLDGFLWFDGVRDKLEKTKSELGKCAIGRKEDRQAYRQAQLDAKAKNLAEVERIESAQQRISTNVEADLSARLERLRRELRAKDAAAPRPAGSTQAGAIPPTPGSPDAAPRLCLTSDQLLRAAESEERHDQLLNWIEQQLNVKR